MDFVEGEPLGWASVDVEGDGGAGSAALVVSLGGEIDAAGVDAIRTTLDPSFGDGPPERLVFDLSGVEFMDSAGITLLLEYAKRAGSTLVRNPSRSAELVIAATGLADWLPSE